MRLPHHSGYLWRCSLKIKGEKEKLSRLPMANMPFYIVYSKANCTTNSLQACNKAVLLFGVVLAKVKYPATKIIRYVENHPEKKRGTWAVEQPVRSRKRPVQVQTYPGPDIFLQRVIKYFGIIQVCEPIIACKIFFHTKSLNHTPVEWIACCQHPMASYEAQ